MNRNLYNSLKANAHFYAMRFPHIYGKGYNPDEPRDDHGRWATGGSSDNSDLADAGNIGTDANIDNSPTAQSAKDLSVSNDGINFIAGQESFSANQYLDSAGNPTIGYGHKLLPGESYPDGITKDQARQLLFNDVSSAQSAVQDSVKAGLTQNQFDALTSLTYNIGAGNFQGSTLLRLLNQGDYSGAADQFSVWDKVRVGGQLVTSPGLVNRRNAEQNLFLNGTY